MGAHELHCDFEDVMCRRAPAFDSYADVGRVPVAELINAGWWFECIEGSARVDGEPEDEDDNELSPVSAGDHV